MKEKEDIIQIKSQYKNKKMSKKKLKENKKKQMVDTGKK